MIFLNYTRLAEPMADHEALRFADRLKRSFDSNATWDVSNEVAILAVRVLVAEGVISIADTPIMLQYEGKDVGEIKQDGGMPVNCPIGFCDYHFQLSMRGQHATLQKKVANLGDDFKQKYGEAYIEWLKENVMEILTPDTEFYFEPQAMGAKEIKNLNQRQLLKVEEWVEHEGMYYLRCAKGNIPAPVAVEACYDTGGEKYIVVPFNDQNILAEFGIKPQDF